jgi:hypothetical protein
MADIGISLFLRKHLSLCLLLSLQTIISIYWFWVYPSGDEAVHMYNSYRISQGEWPYVDFFSYLTPGTYLLGGAVLWLTGGKIVYLRVLMMSMALAEIVLMDRVIRSVVNDRRSQILWLTVYVSVTALSASYFSHHNIDHFLFVVLLYVLVAYQKSKTYFAWLGLVVATDSFVHHAHGFYYFVAVSLYLVFLLNERRIAQVRYLGMFVLPILILYIAFVAWLLSKGSLSAFVKDAILWVLNVYGKDLAFGIFEDTLFYLETESNVTEQAFFLVAKIGILMALMVMALSVVVPLRRNLLRENEMLIVMLLLAAGVGSLQTLHNPVAYYVLFFVAMGVYLGSNRPRWIPYALLLCTCIQVIRVVSFPVRHAEEYNSSHRQLVSLGQNYLTNSPEAAALVELSNRLKENGVDKAVVVGRSPEVYLLAGIRNPTRHDVVLPIYLTEEQLKPVEAEVRSGTVIYDRTLEKLQQARDFFDVHHYKKDPRRLEWMAQSGLFQEIRRKPLLFQTSQYEVYGVEAPQARL